MIDNLVAMMLSTRWNLYIRHKFLEGKTGKKAYSIPASTLVKGAHSLISVFFEDTSVAKGSYVDCEI